MLSDEELNAKLKITRQLGTLGVGLLNHEFEDMYKEIMYYRSLDLGIQKYK